MNINPVAFSLFGIDVNWYGILIACGVLFAIYFSNINSNREGLYKDLVVDFLLVGLPIGLIGARAYYVIFEWEYYSLHKDEILAFRNGGLAIYGGIIAGSIVLYFFSKRKKINLLKLADTFAPGLALAQGIGRWGNFVNQEAYGRPTDLPWAININGVNVHPTFLYESIADISIFIFLQFFLYKKKDYDGHIASTYLILYGMTRFFVEGLRVDSLYMGPFRVSQLVSLIIIVLGIFIKVRGKRKN